MPILDLQRRLREVGRIRIGVQVAMKNGKSRPSKLDTFRLTSQDEVAIRAAAGMFGGTVQKWDAAPTGEQWEVITESTVLPVVVPPAATVFSQWMERWNAGGCERRCDGQTEMLSQTPCPCASEDERTCTPHSRVNVILRDLPGLGVWRLDTSGWYAATELAGTVEVCIQAATRGQLLPAVLRLEQRQVKRPGEAVRKFAVPVLDIQVTPSALGLVVGAPAEITAPAAIAGSWQPIEAPAVAELGAGETASAIKDAGSDGPKKRKNSPPDLPPTGIKPRGRKAAEEPEPAQPPAGPTDAQIRKMMALFNELDITQREDRLAFIAAAARQVDSSKDLTVEEAGKVIDALEAVIAGTLDMVYAKDGLQLFAKGALQPLAPVGAGAPIYPDEEAF